MAVETHPSSNPVAPSGAGGWIVADAGLRLIAAILLAFVAVVTAMTVAGFNVDLAVARLFSAPGVLHFPLAIDTTVTTLRDRGFVAGIVCAGCVLLAILGYVPGHWPSIPARAAAYLTTAYLLGPGLLVNGILKSHWGRPRPNEVIDFGGALPFVNWWDMHGACPANCSFISGEAAAAAWLFGPAMLAPRRWRPLTISLAAAFFVMTSGLRMAAGGHFLTDVAIGGLSSVLVLLLLRPLFYPKTIRPDALA